MKNLINQFLTELGYKNYSLATINNYRCDLNALQGHFQGVSPLAIENIKLPDLKAYMMLQAKFKATTINRKVASIKSFFKWLYINEYIGVNPALGLEAPKRPETQPDIINTDDVTSILYFCKSYATENDKYYRDYAMTYLLLCTGIRRMELAEIKLTDIDFTNKKILINGKGNIQRYVPMNEEVIAILKQYINNFRNCYKYASTSQFLFVSAKAEKMDLSTINRTIDKYLILADAKKDGRSVHALRKKFATQAYNASGDIYAVSKILGHKSVNTTEIYTKANEERLQDVACAVSY